MMPFGITVTVRHRAQDAYGNRTTVGTDTVAGCAFMPGTSTEKMDQRDEITDNGILVMPAGSPISGADQVVMPDGTVFEVNGEPKAPMNGWTGWQPGILVPLQIVTG